MQPPNPFAYYHRAIAYDTAGEHDKAVSGISEALKLDTQYAIAFNARAWMYFEAKKFTQALPDVQRSLDLRADDAASLDTRAHIYEAQLLTISTCFFAPRKTFAGSANTQALERLGASVK
jgi:tetratricopeptide (TPR) repeat protein